MVRPQLAIGARCFGVDGECQGVGRLGRLAGPVQCRRMEVSVFGIAGSGLDRRAETLGSFLKTTAAVQIESL